MPATLSIYNQTSLNDDDFVSHFVARRDLLETLVRRLRSLNDDDSGTHHVLIGSRGMGKTSLLRRTAIAINRDEVLSTKYVPLTFREEQYNVLKLANFWRNCLEALAEWAEATERLELAERLDVSLHKRDQNDETTLIEQLLAELALLGRRAVLLIDNVDIVLENLSDRDQWALRRSLQARGGPIVIGAAARALKESADRDGAFYEFFQPDYLDPLDIGETQRCMRALANRRGEVGKHVLEVLDRQPARLKTLHTLTGGNPRVLTLIYRLLESAESEAAMADLEALLDQVTPYYKARVEEYHTAQQRAVVDAIALHWDPITTGELSDVTGIQATTLSPLLIKLRKDGLIESLGTSGSYSGHQLVERFLNIWYLMRHGTRRTKQKMRWLVGFLTSFYSRNELLAIASSAKSKGLKKSWHIDFASAFDEALARQLAEVEPAAQASSSHPIVAESEVTAPLGKKNVALQGELKDARALARKATSALNEGRYRQAIKSLDKIIDRFHEHEDVLILRYVVRALFNKGLALSRAGDDAAAISTYDAAVAHAGSTADEAITVLVAKALVNKAFRLWKGNETEASIAVSRSVVTKFGDSASLKVAAIADNARLTLALGLARLGSVEEAIATFEQIVERRRTDEFDLLLARALLGLGIVKRESGDNTGALEVFDEIVTKGDDPNSETMEAIRLDSFLYKGQVLAEMSEHRLAAECFDAIIENTRSFDDEESKRKSTAAYLNKAMSMVEIGGVDAEIAVLDEVVGRYRDEASPVVLRNVVGAMRNKAISLSRNGQHGAAIGVYDEIIERGAHIADRSIQIEVAAALHNKAAEFGELNDLKSELSTYDTLIERFGVREDREFVDNIAKAMMNRAITLDQLGEKEAAAAAYQAIIERFGGSGEAEMQDSVATSMFWLAFKSGEEGDVQTELAAYDEIIRKFSDYTESDLRAVVARSMFFKAMTLDQLGCIDDAIVTFENIISFINEEDSADVAELGAAARINLANLVVDTGGDLERAESLYHTGYSLAPLMGGSNLAWMYLLSGRFSDAEEARRGLSDLAQPGQALLDAGLEFARENFGLATEHLDVALNGSLESEDMDFRDDLYRLLRLAESAGFGERLISWLESGDYADKIAPVFHAFNAYVRGERVLLDVNPEVRDPAQAIYDRLDLGRRRRSKVNHGLQRGRKQEKRS